MSAVAAAIPTPEPSPVDEDPRSVDDLPLDHRFELGDEITPLQNAFLDKHGYLVFSQVARPGEVTMIKSELERIEREWIAEGRRWVNGVPVFYGRRDGEPFVQRFTFTSTFSDSIKQFVHDSRFEPGITEPASERVVDCLRLAGDQIADCISR